MAEGEEAEEDGVVGSLSALSVSGEATSRLWTVDWNATVRLEHADDNQTENTGDKGVRASTPATSRLSAYLTFSI